MAEAGAEAAAPGPFDARAYWDRRLARRWNLHGVGLLGSTHEWNRWLYRVRRVVFRRVVSALDLDVRGARVLDVGPGTGFYVSRWTACGAREVVGVDIAASAVQQLRRRFPGSRFECFDISADNAALDTAPEDWLGGPFDVVSAFDVLFHVVDDEGYARAFRTMHRLVRPGGVLVFSEKFVHGRGRRTRHYVSRSLAETTAAATAAGFVVARRVPMFYLMAWPEDPRWRWQRPLFDRTVTPLSRSRCWSRLAGAVLTPVELLLTRLATESPSTEVMVCRRPADGGTPRSADAPATSGT